MFPQNKTQQRDYVGAQDTGQVKEPDKESFGVLECSYIDAVSLPSAGSANLLEAPTPKTWFHIIRRGFWSQCGRVLPIWHRPERLRATAMLGDAFLQLPFFRRFDRPEEIPLIAF